MNNFGKNLALWIVIGLLLVALFNLFQTSSTRGPQSTLAFSDFVSEVNRGQVTDVTIQGSNITGHFADGRAFSTYAPSDPGLVGRLIDKGVRITAAPKGCFGGKLPPLVHSVLPAFWDEAGITAVPHLLYARPGPRVLPGLSLRPVKPLAPPSFTVV